MKDYARQRIVNREIPNREFHPSSLPSAGGKRGVPPQSASQLPLRRLPSFFLCLVSNLPSLAMGAALTLWSMS